METWCARWLLKIWPRRSDNEDGAPPAAAAIVRGHASLLDLHALFVPLTAVVGALETKTVDDDTTVMMKTVAAVTL